MKLTSIRLVSLTALLAATAFTGCNKSDRADASAAVKNGYNETTAAMSNAWNDVKSYSFDKKSDFEKSAKAMSAQMDAQLAEVRANYSEAKASASRKAAMAELKNSEADYKEKMSALGSATAATWDSGKQNVIASWEKLEASYRKARAD